MRVNGIILVLLAVVGCAPATTQGLRENHAGKYEFIANEQYEAVYRKVLYQARKCHQPGVIAAQMLAQGDLFHDIKTGNVTVAMHAAYGVDTLLTVDISALDDKTTNVVVYNALSTWENSARAVREWVLENSTACELQKK
jgi:hypothetical protein